MAVLLGHDKHPSIEYPADHKVGIRVPKGGSNCVKCEYVSGQNCSNKLFVKWNGGSAIPAPTDCYCCDFFEGGGSTHQRANKLLSE